MKYLKTNENYSVHFKPKVDDILLVDTFFQTSSWTSLPGKLPTVKTKSKFVEICRVVGIENKRINTDVCWSHLENKEKMNVGIEDFDVIVGRVELTEESILNVIKEYPHLRDSFQCLLTDEELKEYGYLFRSDKAGLWGLKNEANINLDDNGYDDYVKFGKLEISKKETIDYFRSYIFSDNMIGIGMWEEGDSDQLRFYDINEIEDALPQEMKRSANAGLWELKQNKEMKHLKKFENKDFGSTGLWNMEGGEE